MKKVCSHKVHINIICVNLTLLIGWIVEMGLGSIFVRAGIVQFEIDADSMAISSSVNKIEQPYH